MSAFEIWDQRRTFYTKKQIDEMLAGGVGGGTGADHKAVSIPYPAAADAVLMCFVPIAVQIVGVDAVLVGGSSPSVNFTVRHGPDRSGAGTELKTGGWAVTNFTTGESYSTFDAAVVAPGWIWVEVTGATGNPAQFHVTLWVIPDTDNRSVTIDSPQVGDKVLLYSTGTRRTLKEVRSLVLGTTPSITYKLKHGPDVSLAGSDVVGAGITTTNSTTGLSTTVFDDAVIEPGFVWLEITNKSGTVTQFHSTLVF